jgi:hypothetical protein
MNSASGWRLIITINVPLRCVRDNLRGQKSLGPLKKFREIAHKVIVPTTKNYAPKFLKQWYIGFFMYPSAVVVCCCV